MALEFSVPDGGEAVYRGCFSKSYRTSPRRRLIYLHTVGKANKAGGCNNLVLHQFNG